MQGLSENSFRYHILASAKNFKTSWIELGRALYAVYKDKMFKEWGYATFDTYTSKEIGIRKQTAMKLLKSYYFLEKEEPQYLGADYVNSAEVAAVPSYESVDLLRLAKSKKELNHQDYDSLKKEIFQKGKDVRQVKKDLTTLIRQRQELQPEEAREKKKFTKVKRIISILKSLKQDAEISKLLPVSILRQADDLISKLEAEVS
jgi:Xaa-Pro aminopeptidase